MTKSTSLILLFSVLLGSALVFTATVTPVLGADADGRDAGRDRSATGRTIEPDSLPPNPTGLVIQPGFFEGGITSSTDGSADSGGNEGGTVVTGDESVEVIVVNIGPTNPSPPPPPEDDEDEDGTSAPEGDRRTSSDCASRDSARAR